MAEPAWAVAGPAPLDVWVRAAGRALRVAVSETWHPDGAMVGWLSGSAAPGRLEVLSVPTQEALGLLGADGVRAAWRSVARDLTPDLVLVHPPYDLLDAETLAAVRATGARVVGLAFDEPLFAPARRDPAVAPRFAEAAARFDAYCVTGRGDVDALGALGIKAHHLRFATSRAPFEARDPLPEVRAAEGRPLSAAAVLIGRAYPRRQQLVGALVAAGVPVVVFGHGWEALAAAGQLSSAVGVGPPLSRAAMNTVLAEAGVVLTTGDWEDAQVPMVKYRILEAATIGSPQAVQASSDLADYFEPHEISVWSTPTDCVACVERLLADPLEARAMGHRARARVLRDHLADVRIGELLNALADRAPLPRPLLEGESPEAWRVLGALVAHDAEQRGDLALAAAAHRHLTAAAQGSDALAGLQRLALAADQPGLAPDGVVSSSPETTAIGLHLEASGVGGPGLGHLRHLDPAAERLATAFALSPAIGLVDAARARSADTVVAMAAMLDVPEGLPPALTAAWIALLDAAIAAEPNLLGGLHREQCARWSSARLRLMQTEALSRP